MNNLLIVVLSSMVVVMLAHVRVQRLTAAGHIATNASRLEVAWSGFLLPVLLVVWAGIYEMIRSIARGRRQKPPFSAFFLAWVTGRVQGVTKALTVTTCHGDKQVIQVTEFVKPPRPPGRPRKYPEGWQAARRTGRPRGRPRKVLPVVDGPDHDQ